jgi:colanic acid biosynthesis glycosyl transferase WcaI
MKILVSSINYYPDHSGIALYSADLSIFFTQKGHHVTVVTGFPYYPKWKKIDNDNGIFFRVDEFSGMKIYRGYLYVPQKVSNLKRIIHEISFILFAMINYIRAGKHDIIVVLTPPLLLGLVGLLFKKLWGTKLVVHVQDLQLEAGLSLRMIKKSFMIRLLSAIDRAIYKKCDLIISITNKMKDIIAAKIIDEKKINVIYNWIDVKRTVRKGTRGEFIKQYPELAGKFLIAYAGNVGIKQNLDTLLDLAEETKNGNIHYFIIGEGADKYRLMSIASKKKLNNITFHPLLDQEQYYDMLRDIDLSFVSQKTQSGNVFFPSKLLGIMALSKPILISADLDSELSEIILKNGCGVVAAPGDMETLMGHVEYLYNHPEEREKIGRKGYLTVQHLDRKRILSDYHEKIIGIQG